MWTATSRNGDLYGVSTGLANILDIEGFVGCLLFATVDVQGVHVDRCLDTRRPVSTHLPVFVVETLQLQFQVISEIISHLKQTILNILKENLTVSIK